MSTANRRPFRARRRRSIASRADQRWYWSERWQQREREVDYHVAADRATVHESTDDFLAHLDSLNA